MLVATQATHATERTRSREHLPRRLELAQQAYEHSVVLMDDCRRRMAEQRAMLEALRSGMASAGVGRRYAGRRGEVEVYVSRLRRKLERGGSPARIQTVRGRGDQLLAGD